MKHPFYVSALAFAVASVAAPALAESTDVNAVSAPAVSSAPEREFFPYVRQYFHEKVAARAVEAPVDAQAEIAAVEPEPVLTDGQREAMALQAREAERLAIEAREFAKAAMAAMAAREAAQSTVVDSVPAEEEVLMEMDVDMKTGQVVVTDHSANASAEAKPKSFWASLFGAKESKADAVPVIAAFTMAVNEEGTDSPKVTLHPIAPKSPEPELKSAVKAAPVVAAKPTAAATTVAPVVRTEWLLKAGQPIHAQLQAWALDAGWKLNWKMASSWIVPADVSFEGKFDEALERVVTALYGEGHAVRLMLWEGNKYAEVLNVDGK